MMDNNYIFSPILKGTACYELVHGEWQKAQQIIEFSFEENLSNTNFIQFLNMYLPLKELRF